LDDAVPGGLHQPGLLEELHDIEGGYLAGLLEMFMVCASLFPPGICRIDAKEMYQKGAVPVNGMRALEPRKNIDFEGTSLHNGRNRGT
jgi:hypothetical protein